MLKRYFTVVDRESAIPVLDGLRAIAIWLVILRHGVRPFFSVDAPLLPIAGWDLATVFINGWAGVDLFFVISGFLITYHVLARWQERVSFSALRSYFRKRVLRIFPAYYAVVFVLAFGLIPYYDGGQSEPFFRMVAIHLLYLQDYLPSGLLVAAWSLGVEEKFYLLTPVVMALAFRLKRLRSRLVLMLSLSLVPFILRTAAYYQDQPAQYDYAEFFWTYRAPFHHIFEGFYLGAIVALLFSDRACRAWWQASRWTQWVGASGLAIVVSIVAARPHMEAGAWLFSLVAFYLLPLGFAAIMLACVSQPRLVGRLLMNRPAYFFSKISYSWYLVHLTIIPGTLVVVNALPGFRGLAPAWRFFVFFPAYVAVSLFGSLVLHFMVEKPFLLLKDRRTGSAAGIAPKRAIGTESLPGRP